MVRRADVDQPLDARKELLALSRQAAWQRGVALLFAFGGDSIGYSTTIAACSRKELWTISLLLHQRMGQQRVPADQVAMNSACSACERVALWQRCMDFRLREERAVSSAIHACMKGHAWRSASALLRGASVLRLAMDVAAATPALGRAPMSSRNSWRRSPSMLCG
ncbi:unnamed protein product [Durusdinium trenchii]|uniref:Uncharacterized protein n=1 Tax=Durusdinium trenchii TaxID=1381693 RepID=A0ABP0RHR9_9DINO